MKARFQAWASASKLACKHDGKPTSKQADRKAIRQVGQSVFWLTGCLSQRSFPGWNRSISPKRSIGKMPANFLLRHACRILCARPRIFAALRMAIVIPRQGHGCGVRTGTAVSPQCRSECPVRGRDGGGERDYLRPQLLKSLRRPQGAFIWERSGKMPGHVGRIQE